MRWKLLQAFIMVSLMLSAPSGGLAFTFTTIDGPDATSTAAIGINEAGQIVGGYNDANFVGHGFLWDKGTFTTIDPSGATYTAAARINAVGKINGITCHQDPLLFKDNRGDAEIIRPDTTMVSPQLAIAPNSRKVQRHD